MVGWVFRHDKRWSVLAVVIVGGVVFSLIEAALSIVSKRSDD